MCIRAFHLFPCLTNYILIGQILDIIGVSTINGRGLDVVRQRLFEMVLKQPENASSPDSASLSPDISNLHADACMPKDLLTPQN